MHRLIRDVEVRAGRVRDLGLRRVVECADAQTAMLIARDRTMRGLCTRLGERHLLVHPTHEAKARAAMLALGFPLGPASSSTP